MAHSSANSKELRVSLAILTAVVLLALVGLAADGNWPKVERVAISFAAYASTVLLAGRYARHQRHGRDTRSFWVFALGGAVAGIVSGLVRDEVRTSTVAAGAIAAGFLIGGLHWLALRSWRRLRSAVTS